MKILLFLICIFDLANMLYQMPFLMQPSNLPAVHWLVTSCGWVVYTVIWINYSLIRHIFLCVANENEYWIKQQFSEMTTE